MFKLIEGFQGHHRTFNQKNFKYQRGKMATNNEENANILHTHYHVVFNGRADIDYSVLKEIKQCLNSPELGMAPTPNKILSALIWMKNNKATGFSKVTTNMLKNPPDQLHATPNWLHLWILDQPWNQLWILAWDKTIEPIWRKRRPPRPKQLARYLLKRNLSKSHKHHNHKKTSQTTKKKGASPCSLGTLAVKRLSTPSDNPSSSEDNMVYHLMYFS